MKTEATDQAETASEDTATKPKQDEVTLSEPVQRGDTRIEKVLLRKPKGGALRGLNLQDLITCDIATLHTLIPRITNPPLTKPEAEDLDPADLAEIGGVIRGFFMTAAEKKMIETMIAEQQPRS